MAVTRFPIETTEAKIQVTLPIGLHVLELVVEDSAGLRSAPDQVIIEVRKAVALPTITGILPVSGIRGATVEAVISGTLLTGATAVTFAGTGITATIGSGATADKLPVKLQIATDAPLGDRTFTVETPAGTASSPTGGGFSVIALEPRIVEPLPITPPRLITVEPVIAEPRALTPEPRPTANYMAISPLVGLVAPTLEPVANVNTLETPTLGTAGPGRVETPILGTATPVTRVVTPGKAAPKTKKGKK